MRQPDHENHQALITSWINARTVANGETFTGDLFKDYIQFCNDNGTETIPPIQQFGAMLSFWLGYQRRRARVGSRTGTLIGLSLKPTDPATRSPGRSPGRRAARINMNRLFK